MSLIAVNTETCARDGLCIEVCPLNLLDKDTKGNPRMASDGADKCVQCGHCVAVCRNQALRHELLPAERFGHAQARGTLAAEAVDGFLRSRRSCREFKSDSLSREALTALLDTVRYAPTASNSQQLRWIATAEPATTREVAALSAECLRKDPAFAGLLRSWDQGRDIVLRGAPHVIVALAPSDYLFAEIDCATALSYLELLANARGYGACWAGVLTIAARRSPELRQRLAVPEGFAVNGGMMLGRPKYRYALVPPRKEPVTTWV